MPIGKLEQKIKKLRKPEEVKVTLYISQFSFRNINWEAVFLWICVWLLGGLIIWMILK